MNLVNMLLGVSGRWPNDEEITTALVIRDPNRGIPTYTPVIVPKHVFTAQKSESRESGKASVVLYFPTPSGHHPRYATAFNTNNLYALGPNGVTSNRRVKITDEFDFKKINKIAEFLKTEGALTILMENPKAAESFISKLGLFKKEFEYSTFYGHWPGNESPRVKPDLLTMAITLYDLPCAIPVFNHKKADGMGVTITTFWPKTSEVIGTLYSYDEMSFAVNKYSDNLLYIDGTVIAEQGFVENGYVEHFTKILRREVDRRKGLSKSLRQEKKAAKKLSEETTTRQAESVEQTTDAQTVKFGGLTTNNVSHDVNSYNTWVTTGSTTTSSTKLNFKSNYYNNNY